MGLVDCSYVSGSAAHGPPWKMAVAAAEMFVQASWGIDVVLHDAMVVVADVARMLLREDLGTHFGLEHVMVLKKVVEMAVDSEVVAADGENPQMGSLLRQEAASELAQKMQPL